jgi:hypothetical protein
VAHPSPLHLLQPLPQKEAATGNNMEALHVAVGAWKRLWEKGNEKQKSKQPKRKSKKIIQDTINEP